MGWLILAAGRSTRYDGDKLLSLCPSGKTLIEECIKHYQSHGAPVMVVTRPDHNNLHALLTTLHIDFTVCRNSEFGMANSLAWGVRQVAESWPWVGVVLGDMAFIKPTTLSCLTGQITNHNIVMPVFDDSLVPTLDDLKVSMDALKVNISHGPCRGHPVLFGKVYFSELSKLSGDAGARILLKKYDQYLVKITTSDYGVLLDVDSRLDMKNLLPLFESQHP